MSPHDPEYDVAILGAGPAGSTTALALRRSMPARVLLAEASRYRTDRVGESLAPEASHVLHGLGLLEAFRAEGHDVCPGNCSAWGSDVLGHSDFLFGPYGPGWHLDRARFDAFMAGHAAAAGADLRTGLRFTAAERTSTGFHLRFRSTEGQAWSARARFVVDATGLAARFARAQGAVRRVADRLLCFVELWRRTSGDTSRLSLLEAAEYGWWYSARLPGARIVTMLATDGPRAGVERLTDDTRRHEVLMATKHVAPRLTACGAQRVTSLQRLAPSVVLDPIEADGWLTAGDAASAFDPLSASGILKALRDGVEAARWLAAALQGQPLAPGAYARAVEARYRTFLDERASFYEGERRWLDAPFWQARAAASRAAAVAREGDGALTRATAAASAPRRRGVPRSRR